MNRVKALRTLFLPKDATSEQIEESYNQLREFYYPDYYGAPHEFTPQQIQEHLYADLSGGYYKEPKGVQYKNFVQDAYHYALLSYARVCAAYNYLTDPANRNEHNVDPNSNYGRDVLRFGRGFANFRKIAGWLIAHLSKPVLIIYLISGLLSVVGNRKVEILNIVCNVSKYLYITFVIGNCIIFPGSLLEIPRVMWVAFVEGFKSGPWLLRPFKALLFSVATAAFYLIGLVVAPGATVPDPDGGTAPLIKKEKAGRAYAEAMYNKVLSNIETLHENGCIQIDDKMSCIRKALEALAEDHKRAKNALSGAAAEAYLDMQQEEKSADLMKRFGDVDEYEQSIDRVLELRKKQEKQVNAASREFAIADRLLYAFARRAGADPEDYIDKK